MYENLLPLIEAFTDNYPGYQAYEDTFVDKAKKDRLFELAEKIAGFYSGLNISRGSYSIYDNFQLLSNAISDMFLEYSDHPAARFSEVLMMIKIIDVIEQEVSSSGNPMDLTLE
ncbi:hypothetical protein EON78_05535, partial [bacterium]